MAAGRSRRFGSDKLLMPYRGRPLVAHVLEAVTMARADGHLAGGAVVLPRTNSALRALATGAGCLAVINDDPDDGLAHSLALGLARLGRTEAGAAVVLLGDQPMVRAEAIAEVLAPWRAGDATAVRACYRSDPTEPGHPVVLDRAWWSRAGELRGDHGFGRLLAGAPDAVLCRVTLPGGNPDVDTPADLSALPR